MEAQAQAQTQAQAQQKFRIQSQRMLLTYKTHLNKENYIDWANKKFKTSGIKFIRLAHETGDEECPYEHTHIVIELNKRCNLHDPRCLDISDIHPHIKTLPNAKALEDAKQYISKEDPDNKDLLVKETILTKLNNCNTLKDALMLNINNKNDLKYVNGLATAYNAIKDGNYRRRTSDKYSKNFELRPWQLDVNNILEKTPDDRHIIWIYDKIGGSGKTYFAKYLTETQYSRYRTFTDLGTIRDAATVIEGELQRGWESWGLFINLCRQSEHHTRMYSYIEAIKDGSLTTTKYQGKSIQFDEPHIIIFANWPPNIKELSMDRWIIYEIINNELIKKSLQEVEQDYNNNLEENYRINN